MNILNLIRWISFIPLGLVGSSIIGPLIAMFMTSIKEDRFFEGHPEWYIWLINGVVVSYSFAWISFYIAPKINRFCKWIIVGLILFMGISKSILVIFDPVVNYEKIEILRQLSITIIGLIIASWSLEEIKCNFGLHNKQNSESLSK